MHYALVKQGCEVVIDDRVETPCKKFADADLSFLLQVIIDPRTLERGDVEVKKRQTGER